MPLELRKLIAELKTRGFRVQMTQRGHYYLMKGNKVVMSFAAGHGNKAEVKDAYLRQIWKAVEEEEADD